MWISTQALAQISVALGLFLTAGSHTAMAQGCTYKIAAFTGQPAPGGGTFYHFLPPSIGAGGEIGFIGVDLRRDSTGYGVYAGLPSSLTRVVATGDAAPGAKDAIFEDFSAVSVSKDGGLSINAGVSSDGYSTGIWLASPDGSITGTGGDPTEFLIDALGSATFRSGVMFAKGSLTLTGGFEGPSIEALFNSASSSLADMLTEGTILDGRRIQRIYDPEPDIDSVGATVDSNESGAIALKVAIAPTASPTPFPIEAIYAGDPLSPQLIAEQYAAAPGLADATYIHLSQRPSIAGNGLVAFSALLSLGEGSSWGIFSGAPGAIAAKALEGSIVPTTTNITFGTLSDAVVNSTGDVIFRATINYPNETKREGIWIKRITGDPVLVAISGMTLQTPSGPREVTGVDFVGPGTFDDLHQFVFLAKFGTEDQGIYIADTRPGAPIVNVTRPRKPREFVTTNTSVKVFGTATDDTGVEKVEYTVTREVSVKKKGGKANKPKPGKKKFVTTRVRRAKGDKSWNLEVPLSMGLNLISIVATDKLGNASEPYKIRMLRYQPAK